MTNKKNENWVSQFFSKQKPTDLIFLSLLFLILGVGLICLWSASYAVALNQGGHSYSIVLKQLIYAVLGILAMFVISRFDYEKLKQHNIPYLVLFLSFVLLVIALLGPGDKNGIKRWINVGSMQFQPSELSKFSLILFYSYFIDKFYTYIKKKRSGRKDILHGISVSLIPFLLPLLITILLLYKQPHLSCIVLVAIISLCMMVAGGVRWPYLVGLAFIGTVGFAIVAGGGYFNDRITVWLDPFSDPKGDGWQIIQSLYAIGSGGFLGVGLGNSRQKYMYLPEPENDFIFSVICEELGFIGALAIILLFVLFVYRGLLIAIRAKDKFGSMLVFGTIVQVGMQALLNIAVVSGAAPNTGISLPFFSSGGTSLIMLLMQIGLVLSVARKSSVKKL